jgi:hypothetical protein
MAVLHSHAMRYAHRASSTEDITVQECYEQLFIKCSRTYFGHFESFHRCRSTNGPNVTVQNFVRDVGQAVVGNVNIDARNVGPNQSDPAAAATDAGLPPKPRRRKRRPARVPRVRLDGDG